MIATCPKCSSLLIDDYNENITVKEDGSIVVDPYAAMVCQNRCGYEERLEDV